MALIASYCDAMRNHEHQMALIASGWVGPMLWIWMPIGRCLSGAALPARGSTSPAMTTSPILSPDGRART